MNLVAHRRVVWAVSSGPLRTEDLRRGVGIGGPASPLLWNASYDPIVWAVATASGAPCPTYVDDLAALVESVRQFRLALAMLLTASPLAGLNVEIHQCRRLRATPSSDEHRRALLRLPCAAPDGGSVILEGFGELAGRALVAQVDPALS
jgi:hypothetical protein